ncbi:acyltransferase [Microbacterium sp. cx-55]|uniref:acyltransferase family protein n=1 Tax=Microbacterium sp. cx-55 TaxID=2875948 RepID=UPI001CC0A26A|nr:acyltransferase family protein [Microbacterium sp. cx-55]MBZ4487096.1 acyltransferase [Microbacterium sp. cx-55]UGB36009.1 acyltransferase [Microbacterium sp. cx-55]
MRTEIQALRALAVLGVLVYHLWPLRLTGGFIGVDVFFVVSGFLITDHLLRELATRGRISFAGFWAKRARRLLPASLLVLLATLAGVALWVPVSRWGQFGWEIIASAFYVENWSLAAQSVDYMALSNVKSPVQHFWTLGVEEQFYLMWPVLMVLGGLLGARLLAGRRRAGIAAAIAAVAAASLVYSVVLTAAQPTVAYFSTFTRAWEFAAGALLAAALHHHSFALPARLAGLASWAGFVTLVACMFVFDADTPFPSWTAAVPVAATIVIITAGAPRTRLSPARLFQLRPVQFAGDVSYGTYLWHWPLIVLVPYASGHDLSTVEKLVIAGAALMLGWLSKRIVEDPVRRLPWLTAHSPARTFLAVALATTLVAGAAYPVASTVLRAPPAAEADTSCVGADAMTDDSCPAPEDVPLVASLESFAIDLPPADVMGCERAASTGEFVRCDFGDLAGPGPHVALIGDSHATRWVEALRTAVESQGGSLSTFLVSGCSMMSTELTGSAWGFDAAYGEQCRDISTKVHSVVAADDEFGTVVLTNRTRLYVTDNLDYRPLTEPMVEASISALQDAGKNVVVLKDPPEMNAIPPQGGGSAADCLLKATSPADCALPRSEATFDDPMFAAASARSATVIDLDDLFCTADRCLSRIGGVVVYSDDNHLTRSYAHSLVPALTAQIAPALR